MNSAEPGSDHQLQYARTFATLSNSEKQSETISSLLANGLEGLTLDADLRWHLLCSLAERGKVTRSELDAELKKDPSTLGELSYLSAIAALPTAEDKASAWAQIASESTSNANRVALIKGFNRPLGREFIESYVEKFFELLVEMAGRKSLEATTRYAQYGYPMYITTQATLDRTNQWLESDGKNQSAGLQRLIAEGRDALERALEVQRT
jgi:aminopeptidase N